MEYVYHFESEYGMESGYITAQNIRAATRKLAVMFPGDVGADGFWTNPHGDDFPIDW